jgi:Cu-Zn family superoxide dismutase
MNRILGTVLAAFVVSGCAGFQPAPSATAQLAPTIGNTASGVVAFKKTGDGVLVSGGHFNPDGKRHGAHNENEHHAGDLQSLKSDANGVVKFSYESRTLSVGDSITDVVGHGLIVHRDPDDFKTQPTGNSGPRIACAAIIKG